MFLEWEEECPTLAENLNEFRRFLDAHQDHAKIYLQMIGGCIPRKDIQRLSSTFLVFKNFVQRNQVADVGMGALQQANPAKVLVKPPGVKAPGTGALQQANPPKVLVKPPGVKAPGIGALQRPLTLQRPPVMKASEGVSSVTKAAGVFQTVAAFVSLKWSSLWNLLMSLGCAMGKTGNQTCVWVGTCSAGGGVWVRARFTGVCDWIGSFGPHVQQFRTYCIETARETLDRLKTGEREIGVQCVCYAIIAAFVVGMVYFNASTVFEDLYGFLCFVSGNIIEFGETLVGTVYVHATSIREAFYGGWRILWANIIIECGGTVLGAGKDGLQFLYAQVINLPVAFWGIVQAYVLSPFLSLVPTFKSSSAGSGPVKAVEVAVSQCQCNVSVDPAFVDLRRLVLKQNVQEKNAFGPDFVVTPAMWEESLQRAKGLEDQLAEHRRDKACQDDSLFMLGGNVSRLSIGLQQQTDVVSVLNQTAKEDHVVMKNFVQNLGIRLNESVRVEVDQTFGRIHYFVVCNGAALAILMFAFAFLLDYLKGVLLVRNVYHALGYSGSVEDLLEPVSTFVISLGVFCVSLVAFVLVLSYTAGV